MSWGGWGVAKNLTCYVSRLGLLAGLNVLAGMPAWANDPCIEDNGHPVSGAIVEVFCEGDQSDGVHFPRFTYVPLAGWHLLNPFNPNTFSEIEVAYLDGPIVTNNISAIRLLTYAQPYLDYGHDFEARLLPDGAGRYIGANGVGASAVELSSYGAFLMQGDVNFPYLDERFGFSGSDLSLRIDNSFPARGPGDGAIYFDNTIYDFGHDRTNSQYANWAAGNAFSMVTTGNRGHGVVMASAGGHGSGGSSDRTYGGPGGRGGTLGGIVQGYITTYGNDAAGILMRSLGGNGGNGHNGTVFGSGGSGGIGGRGEYVVLNNMASISTYGFRSSGIVAQSLGGGGGLGGNGGWVSGSGGAGGSASRGDIVRVTNQNWASIVTRGAGANGILAQSIGGFAGTAGSGGYLFSAGGNGRSGGSSSGVFVTNNASIDTWGAYDAVGILAQSIGGGGGAGGASDGFYAIGGTGGLGGDSAGLQVINRGTINTHWGLRSHGILAQSIGGGGGVGGSANGAGALGGDGNSAGSSGQATVINSGAIYTAGQDAIGIFVQSIGGGGGHGGNASGMAAIGGRGGFGGNGERANVFNDGYVSTWGHYAAGISAQSIGGGGGTGGSATSSGAFASFAMGGSGGFGGNGSQVNVTNTSGFTGSANINTRGDYADGILAQSIGGGGGNGGGAMSSAFGAGFSAAFAIGANGGVGGGAGSVNVAYRGDIRTEGNWANAVRAQSLGGGGGSGGYAISGSAATSGALSFALGGSGEAGGQAQNVSVTTYNSLLTYGDRSSAILAQSIGGGGGNGGFAFAGAMSGVGSLSFALGGDGARGGSGANVAVDSHGNIATRGLMSSGIVAQSIGGGGGNGGHSMAQSFGGAGAGSLALGGSGSLGTYGSHVTVTSRGQIDTSGDGAHGIVAQSIGGGGGNGGFAVAGAASGGGSLSVAVGGAAGGGGGGRTVTVTTYDRIGTQGDHATGILAQSLGGGGGNGGMALAAGASGKGALSVALGGAGGSGGTSQRVSVTANGAIVTAGDMSSGLVAQSIGGGGGRGGMAIAGALSGTASGSLSLGGRGGGGGHGGQVWANATGLVLTQGDGATGVLAQSIGGGGGDGGMAISASASFTASATASIGGSGGLGGNGARVDLLASNGAWTFGDNANALVAQSIGGGGGNGGMSSSGSFAATGSVGLGFGGAGGIGGSAGAVNVVVANSAIPDRNIETYGDNSTAILAQSIGGGGGNGGFTASSANAGTGSATMAFGGAASIGGRGNYVTASVTESILTKGDLSHGLVAQSIGGGGGNGGFSVSGGFGGNRATLAMGGSGGNGQFGGAVTVSLGTTAFDTWVHTEGDGSIGVLAQSIGGGGGNGGFAIGADASNSAFTAGLAMGGSGGTGGDGNTVSLTNRASVSTLGDHATGLSAQSIGGGGGNGGFAVSGGLNAGTAALNVALGGAGGAGGAGSSVALASYDDISTTGRFSGAILAQSIGGGGGNGGFSASSSVSTTAGGAFALGGRGASGGSAGAVHVSAEGQLFTTGDHSAGILAQSIGGGGGNGGMAITGAFSRTAAASVGIGGRGSSGGSGGYVGVTNAATINTTGDYAIGLAAQSIGGGGGNGGFTIGGALARSANLGVTIGGSGAGAVHGGTVEVTNTGAIMTGGAHSDGLLAQSIGGGGGTGGLSAGLAGGGNSASLRLGGGGSGGAFGGTVRVTQTATILTQGDDSAAIRAQSIGGGGGNGGFSLGGTASSGRAATVSLGGNAGTGGWGGTVTVNNTGDLFTLGDRSAGLVAQSIGGGGGAAGSAGSLSATSGNALTLALGGTGGNGGNGNAVTVTNSGTVSTAGEGAQALLAQSIGGGGGNAGGTLSLRAAGAASASLSIGARGGIGGSGGTVDFTQTGLAGGGTVLQTRGQGAEAMLLQSIGGGGGNGSYNIAGGGNKGFGGSLSVGASGGAGGNGGTVTGRIGAAGVLINVYTHGDDAAAIRAQSIGGGGGNGSFTMAAQGTSGAGLSLTMGGRGGSGGAGSAVSLVQLHANIYTTGAGSAGITAESIGGGGGSANVHLSGAFSKSNALSLQLGADGGTGSRAGDVRVVSNGQVITQGTNAAGIIARSLGGGGGNAGVNAGLALSSKSNGVAVTLGGTGGSGGHSGAVSVVSGSVIDTASDGSGGIMAHAIGGGGGTGGFAGAFAGSFDDGKTLSLQLGGNGGVGHFGGTVDVTSNGAILTRGADATGISALSLGGGGGSGGGAMAFNFALDNEATQLALANGGAGVTGGYASGVTVTNMASIATGGTRSHGITAQSIGGGGGNGGQAVAGSIIAKKAGSGANQFYVALGGSGGDGNHAGAVNVQNHAGITTLAGNSHAILAQSIGGGGGTANQALSIGFSGADSTAFGLSLGGDGGTGGYADQVAVTNSAALFTQGVLSRGIQAQSIGGGGGAGGFTGSAALGRGGDTTQYAFSIGGAGGDGNIGGAVSVTHSGYLLTTGAFSEGVLAQSIGGGGGAGGSALAMTRATTPATGQSGDPARNLAVAVGIGGEGGTGAHGGAVTVDIDGVVNTFGLNSHGVMAQSIGGGGGSGGNSKAVTIFAGTADTNQPNGPQNKSRVLTMGGNGGAAGNGGDVTVENDSWVVTYGANAFGVMAQSVGGGGGVGGHGEHGKPTIDELVAIGGDLVANLPTLPALPAFPSLGSLPGLPGATGLPGLPDLPNLTNLPTLPSLRDLGSLPGLNGATVPGLPGLPALPGLPMVADLPEAPDVPGLPPAPDPPTAPEPPEADEEEDGVSRFEIAIGGRGGASGDGGLVTVTNRGNVMALGEGAIGVFAQSVGGGGGLGGYGAVGETGTIGLGGSGGAGGIGGDVLVTNEGLILTAGTAGYGIFAQSVGGGGGMGGNVDRGVYGEENTDALAFGASGGAGGNGGDVTVVSQGAIVTLGDGATAIFAQSVGGGGGVLGQIGQGTGLVGSTGAIGTAGDVLVDHTGTIITAGDGAHGIYATALDGAGAPSGSVTVNYTGDITVLGDDAYAILAQTTANGGQPNRVDIGIGKGSTITGGSNTATVSLVGGTDNTLTNEGQLQSSGGLDATVIEALSGNDAITNAGVFVGSFDLGSGQNLFDNQDGALMLLGAQSHLHDGSAGASGLLMNAGELSFGDTGYLNTAARVAAFDPAQRPSTLDDLHLTGDFQQAAVGTTFIDLDFGTRTADHLINTGYANWDGTLSVLTYNASHLRSGTSHAHFSTASAGADMGGLSLDIAPSAIVDYWIAALSSTQLAVQWDVDFTPADANFNRNQTALGAHLNSAFKGGAPAGLQDLSAALFSVPDASILPVLYDSMNAEVYAARKASNHLGLLSFAERFGRCELSDETSSCVTFSFGSEKSRRSGDFEYQDQATSRASSQLSAARELDNGARLGFGLDFGSNTTSHANAGARASGRHMMIGLNYDVARYGVDWKFGLAGGQASSDIQRSPFIGGSTEGTLNTSSIALSLGAEKQFDLASGLFVRPGAHLSLGKTASQATQERGGDLGLALEHSTDWFVVFTPSIELGFDGPVQEGCRARCSSVTGGLKLSRQTYLGNRSATSTGRFIASPAGSDPFTVTDALEDSWAVEASVGLELAPLTSAEIVAERRWLGNTTSNSVGFRLEHAF